MRINLIFGFLGSGKTTLVRRILMSDVRDRKMAVIINEFGDVSIDGAILSNQKDGKHINMVELTSGCLCCTLKGSLLNAVEELRIKEGVDILVIEATGIAEPEEMIETFSDPSLEVSYQMGPMITIVDTPKFLKIREILGPFYEAQVRNADMIILNKIDMAHASDLEAVRKEIVSLNRDADYVFAEQCDVDINPLLFKLNSRVMFSKAETLSKMGANHDHHHAPAQSFVLDASKSFRSSDLKRFFTSLPENVWRAKGFTLIDDKPSLLQFTMGELDITPVKPGHTCNMVFIGSNMDQRFLSECFNAIALEAVE